MVLWRCFYPPLYASILKWIQSSYKKPRYQRCSSESMFSEGQMYLSSKLLWLLNTHLVSLFMPSERVSQRTGFSTVVCWHKHIEIQISRAHCQFYKLVFRVMLPSQWHITVIMRNELTIKCGYELLSNCKYWSSLFFCETNTVTIKVPI